MGFQLVGHEVRVGIQGIVAVNSSVESVHESDFPSLRKRRDWQQAANQNEENQQFFSVHIFSSLMERVTGVLIE